MDLNFQIKNQICKRIDDNTLVNLSENYLRLCFTFQSDDWNGLSKFALFKHDGKTTRIALSDNKVVVPASLLSGYKLVFSLYGVDTPEDTVYRITTNIIRLHLIDSGYTNDVDDPLPDDPDVVEEIYIAIGTKADKVHTHTKSDITDFSHNHDDRYYTESEVDTLLEGKSDTGHTHDDRYYTEDEVDELIEDVKHELNNRVILTSDKSIIQTGEKADLTAYAVLEGVPQQNKEVYFYIKEDN